MNISFNIIYYTEARTKREWELVNQNRKIYLPTFEDKIKPYAFIFVIVFVLCCLYLPLTEVLTFGSLIIIVFIFWVGIIGDNYNSEIQHTSKSFQYFGEKMSFFTDTIQISSPIDSLKKTFIYTDIPEITLCFKEYEHYHIAIFRWNSNAQTHQYTLKIEQVSQKQELIQVLKYLYEKGITVKELTEDGKKMYLLKSLESDTPKKIDKQYLDLIDEIGEKD